MGDGVGFYDERAVRHLKYLQNRSLGNPQWRDADYLALYIKPTTREWEPESPLEERRVAVEQALRAYKAAKRKAHAADLDDLWTAVLGAVDQLIVEAERILGYRIKPTA